MILKTYAFKMVQKVNIWQLLFLLIPALLLGNITELFGDKNEAYPIIFTLIGVALGFLAYFLTKKKSSIIKTCSLAVLILFSFSFIILTQKNELEREWIHQTINSVPFSSPTELKRTSVEIPEALNDYYNKIEIFNDDNGYRSTTVLAIALKDANIDLQNYFEQYLNSYKEKIPNIKAVEIIDQTKSEYDLYIRFKMITNKKSLNGICRVIQQDKNLYMFWLIPFSKGYSKEYMERFNNGILK